MRKVINFLDPVTQSALMLIIAIAFIVVAFKQNTKSMYIIAAVLTLIGLLRAFIAGKRQAGLIFRNEYPGNVKLLSEDSKKDNFSIIANPKIFEYPILADGIKTDNVNFANKVFKLRSGVNAYIDSGGMVRCFSPVSAWVNPGLVKKDFFTDYELSWWKYMFSDEYKSIQTK